MKLPFYHPHHKLKWVGLRDWKRHSLVLLVGGSIYVMVGFALIFADPTSANTQALHIAINWMSLTHWGYVFIFAGILAIISSRWPPVSETWGYTVLTGLSAGWGAFYLVGIVFADSPMTNIRGVLTWGLLAFMWWAISGLRNPSGKDEEIIWTALQLPASSSQQLPD